MIRSKGDLIPLTKQSLDRPTMDTLLYELIDEKQRTQFDTHHDLDFAYAYGDKARFRANYLYKLTGPGAVFRTIPSKVLTAQELGLSQAILNLAERKAGLV